MQSAAGDNEAEGFKGWLYLDYWPFRYLCQGSLLTSVAVLTRSGVSRKTVWLWLPFTNEENQILKFSKSSNHWKFRENSSIGQFNVIRNSGVLKTGSVRTPEECEDYSGYQNGAGSGFAEIRSGNRILCPESYTYRTDRRHSWSGTIYSWEPNGGRKELCSNRSFVPSELKAEERDRRIDDKKSRRRSENDVTLLKVLRLRPLVLLTGVAWEWRS